MEWSNLPGDILSIIVKLLNSDIDILRLRSVCPSWRSSIRPSSRKPFSFPIKVRLNLLDYRISEICKSYTFNFVCHEDDCSSKDQMRFWKKAIAIGNYIAECDFAFFIMDLSGYIGYWKIGDEYMTRIDTQSDVSLEDIIFYDEKCYAVYNAGTLVCLDCTLGSQYYLVEFVSDMYTVSVKPQVIKLFRFNKCKVTWDCIDDLGDKALLLVLLQRKSKDARVMVFSSFDSELSLTVMESSKNIC